MRMVFGQVQPDSRAHEDRRDCELRREGIAIEGERQCCPKERRQRKVGACARRAEMT